MHAQLAQVREAASSLERVASAMARQARSSGEHGGRATYTVGPIDGHQHVSEGGRRSSMGQRFSLP